MAAAASFRIDLADAGRAARDHGKRMNTALFTGQTTACLRSGGVLVSAELPLVSSCRTCEAHGRAVEPTAVAA